MTAAHNGQHRLLTSTTWSNDSSRSSFNVVIKHRSGPISIAGTFQLLDGSLQAGSTGDIRIEFTIDTASLELIDRRRGGRIRSHKIPNVDSSRARFESSSATDRGAGRLHVRGLLTIGQRTIPIALDLHATNIDDAIEITATATADHRRLGISWIPAAPLKKTTELIATARLIPSTDPAGPRAADRRSKSINSRYRFMGGGPAPTLRTAGRRVQSPVSGTQQ